MPDMDYNESLCTDEELLQEMAEGRQEAFKLLYRRYWEEMFVTATNALRNKDDAADVVQDIFLSIWNRRHELDIRESVAAYLHSSVRYKCIHYIEKNITRHDYLVHLADVAVSFSHPNAEIDLQLKELQQTIRKSIDRMPPKMQKAYKLSRQEHLTYKEISNSMSISVETVKKHIQHALCFIRKDLPPYTLFLIIVIILFFS
jgi:RNA polymerase sigma-70 factor (ECF subfamily)